MTTNEYTTDTRTEAERRYDATRLRPSLAAEPDSGELTGVYLGTIDGCPVLADYMGETGELAAAAMTWNGLRLASDGRSYLSVPMSGCFAGDMRPAEWLALKQLAQTTIAEQLIALARCYPHRDAISATVPTITVETWSSEAHTYTDYQAGSGLTGVMIGTYDNDKPGVELIIGGKPINEMIDQVMTLADVRQLRDNLTALLNDARLVAAERRANLAAAARLVDACVADIRRAT